MHILIIHGQDHVGSTCTIARLLAEKIGGEVKELFLPRDFSDFCIGCTACFLRSEIQCPHYSRLQPITAALDNADIIILASPVYVLHASAPMKNLLDHYGWRFLIHRPDEGMFHKVGVVISTAAGSGSRSTNRDMADSLCWWGCKRVFRFGMSIFATRWEQVTPARRRKIQGRLDTLARKVRRAVASDWVSVRTKLMFTIARMILKRNPDNTDGEYWSEKGWFQDARPWRTR